MDLPQELVLGRKNPFSRKVSIWVFTYLNSAVDSFYVSRLTGFASVTRLNFYSTLRSGGNPLGRSSGKTSKYCGSNDWRVDEDVIYQFLVTRTNTHLLQYYVSCLVLILA
jgi:hypothetical protein